MRLIIFLMVMMWTVGAWGATYKKAITLSGTGSAETNYILPLNIHYGSQQGDVTGTDVFLDGKSNTNFSDIRFKDASGNNIPYYVKSTGNYEVIPDDSKVGDASAILSTGTIIASGITGQTANRIYKSTNNGTSWTNIYTGAGATNLLFVDSQDWIYIADGYLVKRSKDTGGTWTTIHDNTTYAISIPFQLFAEDASHNVFIGRYTNGSTYNPAIYKVATDNTETTVWGTSNGTTWQGSHAYSLNDIVIPATPNGHFYICTVAGTSNSSAPTWPTTSGATVADGGVTWTESYLQHIHGIGYDSATGYLYAGVDAAGYAVLIRSVDGGATWTIIKRATDAAYISFVFGSGYRVLSGDASAAQGGHALMRTTDDSTFSVVAANNLSPQSMKAFGSGIYAAGSTYGDAVFGQLLRSADNGATWQSIATYPIDTTPSFEGPNCLINSGTPTGTTEAQLLLGMKGSFKNSRIFDGGSHYQALVYIKIPSLPAGFRGVLGTPWGCKRLRR